MFQRFIFHLLSFLLLNGVAAQKEVVKGWHLLDAIKDGYHGISLRQAKEFLKNKKSKTVIVAVMDGGIDTNHVALHSVLWHNPKEIAGNRRDDDHNGYTDDLYGWNFLGNANGQNVTKESQEVVRVYYQLKPKFCCNQNLDSLNAISKISKDYTLWKKVNECLNSKVYGQEEIAMLEASIQINHLFDSIITTEMKVPEFTVEDLAKFIPTTALGKKAKLNYLRFIDLLQIDRDKTNKQLFNDLQTLLDQQKELQSGKMEPVKNYRQEIVGDNEDDLSNKHYGNSDVMGGNPRHGTHVSGIIAGQYDSASGVEGVCPNARIMTIRCVPEGDEHDKDIALSIIYAVNNGAKVINMSFGKEVSPHKEWIDEAICYAAQHDVLIVHSSGNDGKNIDLEPDYPSPITLNNLLAENVITVGSSGDSSLNGGMVADFTNYGKSYVDVLAPGVKIYSTIPDNQYCYEQGTSMSAPIVSGIAALLRSYYPKLSAREIKYIIEQSVDKSMADQKFRKPGGDKKEFMKMKDICKTGGIVNAYNAVKMAEAINSQAMGMRK